jgi:hypothetical protein
MASKQTVPQPYTKLDKIRIDGNRIYSFSVKNGFN